MDYYRHENILHEDRMYWFRMQKLTLFYEKLRKIKHDPSLSSVFILNFEFFLCILYQNPPSEGREAVYSALPLTQTQNTSTFWQRQGIPSLFNHEGSHSQQLANRSQQLADSCQRLANRFQQLASSSWQLANRSQ